MSNVVGKWVVGFLILAALPVYLQACSSSPGEGLPTLRIWLDQPKIESYARVYVDRKLVSSALRHDEPVDISVKPGEHDLAVELEGYLRATEHIDVHETIMQEFRFRLRK